MDNNWSGAILQEKMQGSKQNNDKSSSEVEKSNSSENFGVAKQCSDKHRQSKRNEKATEGTAARCKHREKSTFLFAIIFDKIFDTKKLHDFLKLRMGNPTDIDFDIIEAETCVIEDGRLLLCMAFSSATKAFQARNKLNIANRGTTSKIYCYWDKNDALCQKVVRTQSRLSSIDNAIKEMVETGTKVMNKHDEKISGIKHNIEKVEAMMTSSQSPGQIENLEDEKCALEDKLEELQRQRNEFQHYIQSMKEKIQFIINDDKFDNKLRDIRIAFGVECQRLALALPMYARREDIISLVRDNQVCVILGETGSGKSTQMVQYLYQTGFAGNGLIVCTQPRKVAAISLATHVSKELASSVGQIVGYQVGMQCKKTGVTKVLFVTDHILLNECLKDRELRQYSCIIIDEAHERSIYTDLLLGMIKQCLRKRPKLKVIITSATIDPDTFVNYFGGPDKCPVLKVSGRTFPVDVVWEAEMESDSFFPEDYESKALEKAIDLHNKTGVEDGDILVFLTSPVETENCVEQFKKRINSNNFQCLQLHGRLKAEEQQLVFEPNRPNHRKIVFATNSAETSITIPGIKFVIDTGVVKEMRFDPKKNMNSLDVVPVSQSSANQRKGRAGRTSSGICYRLYSEKDFEHMETSGSPEILRIQVSQAMLKLLDLGVDPMHFEYVQSPKLEAMEIALKELEEIGAVENRNITVLGKWISKLPVEPKLGMFIKKGIDIGIPIESLVMASFCNQSGIFFRVGSQEEKKAADMKRLKFCHSGGDLLTMLNVYREWDNVNEKLKGKWCSDNSINGKAIKGVREIVKEIMNTLLREYNLKIKYELKQPSESDSVALVLIFHCMLSNLCYYLGHETAGYLIVSRHQRVQLHPSSSLKALGCQFKWVVFNRVLKTSADFITEVTPVTSELIDEAISKNKISLDEKALEKMKVFRVLRKPVGSFLFRNIVGPMHKTRRELEEMISNKCNQSLVIIEVNKTRGEISLYCVQEHANLSAGLLEGIMSEFSEQLVLESKEEPIGNPKNGTRAIVKTGCAVVDILLPHQYRVLNIKEKAASRNMLTEENVKDILSGYGPIEQIWKATGKKSYHIWGSVTFSNDVHAVSALQSINNNKQIGFLLDPIVPCQSQKYNRQQEYTLKLTWIRRASKGHCFVTLNRPEDKSMLLFTSIQVKGLPVIVSPAKQSSRTNQQSDLFIKGLSLEADEDDVVNGLAHVLNVDSKKCKDRFRVLIPRENCIFRSNEMQQTRDQLTTLISQYASVTKFKINLREYKDKTAKCSAFVCFTDAKAFEDVTRNLIAVCANIDGHHITVQPEFKSNVHVHETLYKFVQEEIENCCKTYSEAKSTTILQLRHLKSGHYSIDIVAESPEQLAKDKVNIDKIVEGDILECNTQQNLLLMFRKDGRLKAEQVAQATDVLISVDERNMKVIIQGKANNRAKAIEMLHEYIDKNAATSEKDVCLKGNGNPRGLMKELYIRYKNEFKDLQTAAGLLNIHFNLRSHVITLSGPDLAIARAMEMINIVKSELLNHENVNIVTEELTDCPICLCPVDESDVIRLEYCGHAYCRMCLANMMQNAVSNKEFPINCSAEACNKPLVMRDLNMQLKLGVVKMQVLLEAALDCFIVKNNAKFRYCITPNCPMVYRVTDKEESFHCTQCSTLICTACHLKYHEGMTCAMYKAALKDQSLKNWLEANPGMRKLCPKCKVGIEKDGGCNHISCNCGAHICWQCLQYFATSGACYTHMSTNCRTWAN